TGRQEFLEPFHNGQQNLGPALARLQALVKDQPTQLGMVTEIDSPVRARERLLDTMVANQASLASSPERRTDLMIQGKSTQDAIRRELAAVQADAQHRIAAGLTAAQRARSRRVVTVVAGILAGVGAG